MKSLSIVIFIYITKYLNMTPNTAYIDMYSEKKKTTLYDSNNPPTFFTESFCFSSILYISQKLLGNKCLIIVIEMSSHIITICYLFSSRAWKYNTCFLPWKRYQQNLYQYTGYKVYMPQNKTIVNFYFLTLTTPLMPWILFLLMLVYLFTQTLRHRQDVWQGDLFKGE